LLLFLHGSAERGDDRSLLKHHGPLKHIDEGQAFPFIVLAPQCPHEDSWLPEALSDLLDDICTRCLVDTDRMYVTGFSMGGFGTWDMAHAYPDRFAAIAPIAGYGDRADMARIARLPVWAFNGARDYEGAEASHRAAVEALRAAGGQPRYTVYADADHDAWSRAYADPELYQWLLSHRCQ